MNTVKLNELPYDAELLNALAELENRIVESYMAFGKKSVPAEKKPVLASLRRKPVQFSWGKNQFS